MYDQTRPSSESNDEALVARIVQQDTAAFGALYDRYARTVYVMAVHLLSPADAEEIVQDVFLRLWRRAAQFDAQRGAFRSWFLTIARRRILDELRHANRNQRLMLVKDIDLLLTDVADPGTDVAKAAMGQQQKDALLVALQALPEEQRWAIALAYFGGLSHAEIAQELAWPLGTVKKRIRLGIEKLHHALLPWREVR